MTNLTIIEGTFALITSGNCTESWMLDGDDLQERADAAMDSYWGNASKIIERGVQGFAVSNGGEYMIDLYTTREAAERHISRCK